jgi:HSP20 family protein
MQTLIRHTPTDDAFDNLLRSILIRPIRSESRSELPIKLDVLESETSYRVRADLPGVNKEDIHISIDGNHVTISAELKSEKDSGNGEKALLSERHVGKVARSFTLANEVDESTSEAKYTNGVLELTLQKKVAIKSKRLIVS